MVISSAPRRIMRRIRSLKHVGRARYCPVCDRPSRAFLTFGGGDVIREDARCPWCASLERHRAFWLWLQRRTDFFNSAPARMLHVAPEPLLERRFRQLLGTRYITADLFRKDVDVRMDITDIQFPDASFDFVYCSHVLEHVPDDRKAMREFHRVLKPDGVAVLIVPITAERTVEDPSITDPEERLRLFGQRDHVRRYAKDDYLDRLRSAGFAVHCVSRSDLATPDEITRMGLTWAADVIACRHSK